MRIHKQLKMPWLSYPVPYAIGPSRHSGVFVAYTLRGTPGMIPVAWMLVLVSVIGILSFFFMVNEYGIWGYFVYKGFPIPVIGFGIGQASLFVLALFLFRSGANRQQIVIDTESMQAQIRRNRDYASPVSLASISLQSVALVRPSLIQNWNRVKSKQPLYAAFLHVGEDAEILGVFAEKATALQFVEQLKEETNLPFLPAHGAIHPEVAGFMDLAKGRSGAKVFANRIRERAIVPIGFVPACD